MFPSLLLFLIAGGLGAVPPLLHHQRGLIVAKASLRMIYKDFVKEWSEPSNARWNLQIALNRNLNRVKDVIEPLARIGDDPTGIGNRFNILKRVANEILRLVFTSPFQEASLQRVATAGNSLMELCKQKLDVIQARQRRALERVPFWFYHLSFT